MLKTPKKHCAIVGDQLFTDIMGGNLYGITSILVTPLKWRTKQDLKLNASWAWVSPPLPAQSSQK